MADTFTSLLRLVLQETGGNQNVWGDINNASAIDLLEDSIAARLDLDVTPAIDPVTLTTQNGADDQARNMSIALTGVPGGTRDIIVPSTSKLYIISNETADVMTIKTVANAGVDVRPGTRVAVIVDPVADDVFGVGDVPQATETVQGIAELATQAEVDAGTDDERIVTPLKLATFPAVNQATEDVAGVAEIATQVETDAGVLDTKIVSPLKLDGRQSTTLLTGLARRATQGEVDTGTETDAFVTPATLASAPTGATVIFTGFVPSTGIGETVPAGWSALRNSIGIYTVTHGLGLSDVDDLIICVTAMGEPAVPMPASSNFIYGTVFNRATNSFQVLLGFPDMGTIGGAEHEDHDWNFIAVDNS